MNKIKLAGKCFWYEGGKFVEAKVPTAIYDLSKGRLTADYEYDLHGGTRGSLDVRGKDEILSGIWKEQAPKAKWEGPAQLIHTTGNQKHVFVGTWNGAGESGYGGPGAFVFDLDEENKE